MARPTPTLITALRLTAARLSDGAGYQWGHMGSCNCGHLAQTLTRRSRGEIHQAALERAGDWGQQAIDYCPMSGYPLDHILEEMFEVGLERRDIDELERLNNPEVLARLPPERRHLRRNRRQDAVLYMETWAALLEERWLRAGGQPVLSVAEACVAAAREVAVADGQSQSTEPASQVA